LHGEHRFGTELKVIGMNYCCQDFFTRRCLEGVLTDTVECQESSNAGLTSLGNLSIGLCDSLVRQVFDKKREKFPDRVPVPQIEVTICCIEATLINSSLLYRRKGCDTLIILLCYRTTQSGDYTPLNISLFHEPTMELFPR
jgi:hypothetical protein